MNKILSLVFFWRFIKIVWVKISSLCLLLSLMCFYLFILSLPKRRLRSYVFNYINNIIDYTLMCFLEQLLLLLFFFTSILYLNLLFDFLINFQYFFQFRCLNVWIINYIIFSSILYLLKLRAIQTFQEVLFALALS